MSYTFNLKCASCSTFTAGLLSGTHKADIRIELHCLLWLADNKFVTNCLTGLMQVNCQGILFACSMEVVLTTYSKSAKLKLLQADASNQLDTT